MCSLYIDTQTYVPHFLDTFFFVFMIYIVEQMLKQLD